MRIKILLVEDHTLVRKGLVSLLESESEIEVVGEAENGREALAMAESLQPDIIVMDMSMPELNGLDATRQILKSNPLTSIIILTMYTDEEYVIEVIKTGAKGYLFKQAAPTELITAINTVNKGEIYLSPQISETVKELIKTEIPRNSSKKDNVLTSREREIVQLIAEGNSNKKIAEVLFISVKTVDSHRTKIMSKLKLHSTADITRYAIRKGLVSAEH